MISIKRTSGILLLFPILLLNFACTNRDGKVFIPNVSGKSGELLIVIEDELWKEETGKALRKVFMTEYPSLPQDEPYFDITHIPTDAFTDLFKSHRNIVLIKINPDYNNDKIVVKKEVWAKTQIYVEIQAKGRKNLEKMIVNNSEKLRNYFLSAELNRKTDYFKKYEEVSIRKKIEEKHKISLVFPKGYEIYKEDTNFVWVHQETPRLHQGIIVYYKEYTDTANFNVNRLLDRRDSILKKYIPGSAKNSYMTTERRLPVATKVFMRNGNYTLEIRSLWKVVNDFMGGPFVSYTTLDKERNRLITVEGFLYAGKQDKRNFLWDLEAILNSLKFME